MRTGAIYSDLAIARESEDHLPLIEAQRQVGEWTSFVKEEEEEGLQYALLEVVGLANKAPGQLLESRNILCDWYEEQIGFLWLVLSWKLGRRNKKEN